VQQHPQQRKKGTLLTRFSASTKASNAAQGHVVQLNAALYAGDAVMVTVGAPNTAWNDTTNALTRSSSSGVPSNIPILRYRSGTSHQHQVGGVRV